MMMSSAQGLQVVWWLAKLPTALLPELIFFTMSGQATEPGEAAMVNWIGETILAVPEVILLTIVPGLQFKFSIPLTFMMFQAETGAISNCKIIFVKTFSTVSYTLVTLHFVNSHR
jgi:hypothetical protein